MLKKIKSQVNKQYAIISIYVIITVEIIFALIFATTKIDIILEAALGILGYVTKILTPILVGLIIAYILEPMVVFLEKVYKKIKFFKFKNERKYRSLSIFSCIVVVIFGLLLLIGLFIFSITKQISSINTDDLIKIVSNYINGFTDSLYSVQVKLAKYNIKSQEVDGYITQFSNTLIDWLKNFTSNLSTYTLNVSSYITDFIFGLIIAIYLLLDKDVLLIYGDKFFKAIFREKTQNRIKSYWGDFNYVFSGYIRGQLLDALFMCVMLSLSLSIIGIKFGVLIGILGGMCNLIHYFGPMVAYAGTIFFGLLNAQYNQVLIAVIVLAVIQQIDANIVNPKLLGNCVSLRPIFILAAVIIGASVGGVLGMILAVPITGLLKLFLKRYVEERLQRKEQLAEAAEDEEFEEEE